MLLYMCDLICKNLEQSCICGNSDSYVIVFWLSKALLCQACTMYSFQVTKVDSIKYHSLDLYVILQRLNLHAFDYTVVTHLVYGDGTCTMSSV